MRRDILISIALVLATGLAYFGVLGNSFVNLDDDVYVYENNFVKIGLTRASVNWAFSTAYLGNWHPLTWLSLELDQTLFGLNPRGYHATNLLFHVANTVLVFWLLRNLSGSSGRSAWLAAFFGLHPLHVESVAWISERKDVLSTFFLLLSMLFWLAYVRRGAWWGYALALVLLLFSLMSKAMGVTLPLVLLLVDVWPLERGSRPARLVGEKLPFFLVSAACTALSMLLQGASGAMEYGRSLSLAQRVLLVPVNYVTYLRQTFWPVDLVVLYPHPGSLPLWMPLAAAGLLVAITIAVCVVRKRLPYLLIGWLWFLITLLPAIGFVQLGRQATADRYMYFPIVGLLIMICWGCSDLTQGRRWLRRIATTAAIVLLAICAELTAYQVSLWHDDITLWQHTLAVAPPSSTALGNYGKALLLLGDVENAEEQFRRALAIDPDLFAANFDLGIVLGSRGEHAEAAEYFEKAHRANPSDPLVLDNLAYAEEYLGRFDAALEHLELAAQINPNSPTIRQHLDRVRKKKSMSNPP